MLEMIGRFEERVEWARIGRYSAVSIVGIVVTQLLLLSGQVSVGLTPVVANTLAVSLAAIPVFVLNRLWVWELTGPSSLRREVIPFWSFSLAGLALSTAAVAAVAGITTDPAVVAATNIGAFGVLWVAKFFVLDRVVFGGAPGAPAVAGTTP